MNKHDVVAAARFAGCCIVIAAFAPIVKAVLIGAPQAMSLLHMNAVQERGVAGYRSHAFDLGILDRTCEVIGGEQLQLDRPILMYIAGGGTLKALGDDLRRWLIRATEVTGTAPRLIIIMHSVVTPDLQEALNGPQPRTLLRIRDVGAFREQTGILGMPAAAQFDAAMRLVSLAEGFLDEAAVIRHSRQLLTKPGQAVLFEGGPRAVPIQ